MIWNCNDFRKDLIENEQKKIQGELSLKLEALSLLSKHDKIDDAWEDLKKVVASVISIQKINKYRTWISDYGVDWYREYYKDEGDKNKVNPVRLIADVWSNSDKIGFDCSKRDKELKEWKGYFDECGKTAVVVEGKNAKVVRVLKSGYRSGRHRSWYPIRDGGKSWHDNGPIDEELIKKYHSDESKTGKLGEIIVEGCPQYGLSFLSWPLNIGQSEFCKEILEKFFGDDVKDKRYCLYEMPEAEEDLTSATFFKKRKND